MCNLPLYPDFCTSGSYSVVTADSQLQVVILDIHCWHLDENELCDEKMCQKVFVIVIPKDGLADGAPPIPLWVWHWPQHNLSKQHSTKLIQGIICDGSRSSQCHNQRRARQSFFWYDNNKDLKAHFLVTQLTLHLDENVSLHSRVSCCNMVQLISPQGVW